MEIARDFDISELFFSCTDKFGKVTGGNEVFYRISNYSPDELLGKPHSTIRHPDMPRVVFKLLWEFIEAGKPIVAYVKNRAKDGCYYWVLALANPIDDGYVSVRIKPSSKIFELIPKLYEELKQLEVSIEHQPGARKETAIQASTELLNQRLKELGFSDYSSFMHEALKNELNSKAEEINLEAAAINSNSNLFSLQTSCKELRNIVKAVYEKRSFFDQLKNLVINTKSMSAGLPEVVKRAAINLAIQADHYGESARTISVLSSWLQEGCKLLGEEVDSVTAPAEHLIKSIESAIFELECAYLQIDMIEYYIEAANKPEAKPDPSFEKHTLLLAKNTNSMIISAWGQITSLLGTIEGLGSDFEQLAKRVIGLGLIRVSGRVEASRLPESEKIASMFDGISTLINDAKGHLDILEESILTTKTILLEVDQNKTDVINCGTKLLKSIDLSCPKIMSTNSEDPDLFISL